MWATTNARLVAAAEEKKGGESRNGVAGEGVCTGADRPIDGSKDLPPGGIVDINTGDEGVFCEDVEVAHQPADDLCLIEG